MTTNLTPNSQIVQGGSPDPLEFRRARTLGTFFADDAVLTNADPTVLLVPIAGALLVRLRAKITTTEAAPPNPIGALSFAYRRSPPNHDTAYTVTVPHVSVNVTKATELLVDIQPGGEPYLAVTFTPAVGVDPLKTISVTFFDVMQQ